MLERIIAIPVGTPVPSLRAARRAGAAVTRSAPRRRARRRAPVGPLAASAFALLAVLALVAPPAFAQPRFEATGCWFEVPDGIPPIDCGHLVVPEDRSDAGGREIRLAVAILRHPSGEADPAPVVHLSGGPGEKPLNFLAESYPGFATFFDIGREVIVFEPRGVGFGEPALDCPAFGDAFREILDFEVAGRRLDARAAGAFLADVAATCADVLSERADLSMYSSRRNAEDVADLAAALGYDALDLYATSYGARVALSVVRHHPEIVRSVVLDSGEAIGDGFLAGMTEANERLEALLADCAARGPCAAAFPDLRRTWFETLARLDEEPVALEPVDPLTGEPFDLLLTDEALALAVFMMQQSGDLIPLIPLAIRMAGDGEYDLLLRFYGFFPLRASPLAASYGNFFSVNCRERAPFMPEERYRATVASLPLGSGFWEYFPKGGMLLELCPQWPSGTVDPAESGVPRSPVPTLVLAGRYDTTVPFPRSRQIADALDGSHFFVYPGMGHVVGTSHPCPNAMMLAFVADPGHAPDASCIAAMEEAFRFATSLPEE